MALQLLIFILLLNLTHEAKAEALPQPNLTVDRLVMTETDSVTLNCSAPTHVSVSRCDFYIENKEMSSDSSCVKTLTGSEMLKKLNIRSPSDVKVKCSYVTKIDALDSSSSDSESTTIIINNLLPASLTVNPLVITESDSVTLTCRPPSSVSVSDCFFYIGEEKTPHIFSCVKMMTAADLLSLTKQSLPADIDVTCFYLNSHQSPKSNLLTIIIQQVQETDSTTFQKVTTVSVTAGQTFRTIKETESPFSPPPSSVNPTLFAATDPSGSTTVNTASTLSTSPSEATVVERQDWFPANTDPSGSTTVKTLDSPSEATAADQKLSDKTKWMYVAAPGFGVGVGVVLLVGLLCSRRRSDIKTHRRPPVSYNDKFIGMRKVTNGGLLPVGDEDGYHTITSVPADDSAHEHVAINTQNSQNHDVYHVYSTIPEEPEEAAVAKQLYCTLQPH
ncbi:uncharacterized protein LOC122834296 isoform X3 [Gambusia affinis]|uniref:uncharacterized protein LOC122834296 isoform X3 n=1 Tax=Gambusia affinis TaxID=33528 RepID=UPI001CDC6021|nr:uncharacterized protein LOC122834296 isoform X3 [Gambusia affinis]